MPTKISKDGETVFLIDSHAHLDMRRFDKDRDHVIERALSAGVREIITVGTDANSSLDAAGLAEVYPCVFAAVGIHPHNANRYTHHDLKGLRLLAKRKKVVAIGEIGLDFFRNLSTKKNQIEVFKRQLDMAISLDLPVIIHDRQAHDEVLGILSSFRANGPKGVIHCFSGDFALAEAFMALGYSISIPGTVTLQSASQTRDAASRIPLDRMLLETDAPFLAPLPCKGQRNEPSFLIHTARRVAQLRDIALEELAKRTRQNTHTLFNLFSPA